MKALNQKINSNFNKGNHHNNIFALYSNRESWVIQTCTTIWDR